MTAEQIIMKLHEIEVLTGQGENALTAKAGLWRLKSLPHLILEIEALEILVETLVAGHDNRGRGFGFGRGVGSLGRSLAGLRGASRGIWWGLLWWWSWFFLNFWQD